MTDDPADDGEGAWALDGLRLLFTSTRTGVAALLIVKVDGGQVTRVASGSGSARRGSFAPDGRAIAFGSNRQGNGTGACH